MSGIFLATGPGKKTHQTILLHHTVLLLSTVQQKTHCLSFISVNIVQAITLRYISDFLSLTSSRFQA